MSRQFYVYIMTNRASTVLYTGVTSDLRRRVHEHRGKLVDGFTKRYNVTKLVYYEVFDSAESAILREKQIKAGSRRKKEANQSWVETEEDGANRERESEVARPL